MLTPAYLGIAVAILSVIAAYWVGYSGGFAAGQDRGYGDGKREGAKEGSMRGYAVGYDRAKRQTGGEGGETARRRGLGIGTVGLALAVVGIFFLAASGSKQKDPRRLPSRQRSSEFTFEGAQLGSERRSFAAQEPGAAERTIDTRPDRNREQREAWITRERDTSPEWNTPATSVP